jgi:hypothetical protein
VARLFAVAAPNLCNERAYISKDRVWREIDEELANEPTIIDWIADGQFNHPIRIVAFNTSENWSRDVTANIASRFAMKGALWAMLRESLSKELRATRRH